MPSTRTPSLQPILLLRPAARHLCTLMLALVPGLAVAAGGIDSIVLERDCSGCAHGQRTELRRDGQALWVAVGKARLRTADREQAGRIEPVAFEALAAAVHRAGFFALPDSYDSSELLDGAWTQITVVRHGVAKTVFRRESTGPAELLALEAAIERWRRGAGLGDVAP